MNLSNIHTIYFIGIGGIGMSGLARYFNTHGVTVSGYDKTPSVLTEEMIAEGMSIHFEEDLSLIPKEADLVVYTPAIPADHAELVYYREHQYTVIKRSDLLEQLTADLFTIAVAGTHGKTTTTSMIAHILKNSGYDCTAFLGGIAANYDSNFIVGKNKTVVVEADEFDRSFLKLHPDIAVITSCDADHLDIYGTEAEVKNSFDEFTGKIKAGGTLITKATLSFPDRSVDDIKTLYYALDGADLDFYSTDTRIDQGTYVFNVVGKNFTINDIHLSIAGRHNAENAIAAVAVASLLNIKPEQIRMALQTFKGVKRRFQFMVRTSSTIFIDDYAHHPAEIAAFLNSVREIFPGRKITCVFQPHLYTRTRDFAAAFSESLSLADEVILLPVYPARELPIAGVSSEMLLDKIKSPEKRVVRKQSLISELMHLPLEVLVTIGAGDIDQLVDPIVGMLETRGGNGIHDKAGEKK